MIQLAVSRAFAQIACFTVILFSLAGHAFAQENQVLANAPDLKVGDRWEYVRKDVFTGNELARYSLEVTAIKGDDITITKTVEGTPTPSISHIKPDWSQRFEEDGESYSYHPFVFPLLTNSGWDSSNRRFNAAGYPIKDDFSRHVAGNEKIATAAGSFNTIRIESNGTWQNMSQIYRRSHAGAEETTWYSPQVKNFVKSRMSLQPPSGGSVAGWVDEIFSYSVH